MTEIVEISICKQRPLEYGSRYIVTAVTELFYYELVYRFYKDEEPFLTVSRSTYGKTHDRKSGFTRVLRQENAVKEHARKTVYQIEEQLNIV